MSQEVAVLEPAVVEALARAQRYEARRREERKDWGRLFFGTLFLVSFSYFFWTEYLDDRGWMLPAAAITVATLSGLLLLRLWVVRANPAWKEVFPSEGPPEVTRRWWIIVLTASSLLGILLVAFVSTWAMGDPESRLERAGDLAHAMLAVAASATGAGMERKLYGSRLGFGLHVAVALAAAAAGMGLAGSGWRLWLPMLVAAPFLLVGLHGLLSRRLGGQLDGR